MKQIKLIPVVVFATFISCSNMRNKATFEHFDPVAYIDTNRIASNYVKSYLAASLIHDALVERFNNTASDDNEVSVITGELLLNKQLYQEGLTYSYCKDSLDSILERSINSYMIENKDMTGSISEFQSNMDIMGVVIGIGLNKSAVTAKTDQLLNESKTILDNVVFSTQEISRTSNSIIYKLNILNSDLDKYSINIKFNFDGSWNISNIELL